MASLLICGSAEQIGQVEGEGVSGELCPALLCWHWDVSPLRPLMKLIQVLWLIPKCHPFDSAGAEHKPNGGWIPEQLSSEGRAFALLSKRAIDFLQHHSLQHKTLLYLFRKILFPNVSMCVYTLTLLCTVFAVPVLALLLLSGVLEGWKHLTGRFNIQLTRSQPSYITAENPTQPPPPAIILTSWLLPYSLPLPLELSPSLFSLLPLSSVFVWAARGVLTALQLCLSISSPADCIWSEWIVFHLEVIASPPISVSTPTLHAQSVVWRTGA